MSDVSIDKGVVVRFAPSPTGSLHVGGARTALFNALLHERQGGRFIFRVEDTDKAREVEGAASRMLADLKWLGIEFNEGEGIGGDHGPYLQSERSHFYAEAIRILVSNGAAYRCFCTPERITALHEENAKAGRPPRYDRHCRDISHEDFDHHVSAGEASVIRLSIETDKVTVINDLVKGQIAFAGENLDDPILVRSDGSPTGLLAGAIDDHTMGVTRIFRGDEWLPSTPYQYRIFEGLGGPIPEWGHLSLLVDENHAKLSKRTAGLSVGELKAEGILPEALRRYLAGLGRSTIPADKGWSISDLAADFDPTKYRSGEIVYSKSALLTENQKYMRSLKPEDLLERFNEWNVDNEAFGLIPPARRPMAMPLALETASTLEQCLAELKSISIAPELSSINREEIPTGGRVVEKFLNHLNVVEFTETGIQSALGDTGRDLGIKGKDLYHPIRLALSGQTQGPKLAAVMMLIGKEESTHRFEKFMKLFS